MAQVVRIPQNPLQVEVRGVATQLTCSLIRGEPTRGQTRCMCMERAVAVLACLVLRSSVFASTTGLDLVVDQGQ